MTTNEGNNNSNKKRKRRLDKDQDCIVIIGCGLAGLSAALALERAGFNRIAIYERDDSLERQKEGYGLTLTYNPKGPLAALGLLEDVAQKDCPSRSHYLFRPDGNILGYFGNAFGRHQAGGQRGNLRVPRRVLRRLLLEQLQVSQIHWDHKVIQITWNEESMHYDLEFQKGGNTNATTTTTRASANLLIAADGIRSTIVRELYDTTILTPTSYTNTPIPTTPVPSNEKIPRPLGGFLRHLNVRLILGLADFMHPLLNERGFYTLDGKHRLFTMPYESSRNQVGNSNTNNNNHNHTPSKNRIMWQLSFATSEEDDERQALYEPSQLRDQALQICQLWHSPVLDLIQATKLDAIWGTDLLDRDPETVWKAIPSTKGRHKRLVVVGDALHSMSPFKGQGANQALADGPLLASHLSRASIDAAVTAFWREAVQRSAPIVAASRLAAIELHSPKVVEQSTSHGFAGVRDEAVGDLLQRLQSQNIGAHLGGQLDAEVLRMIQEMDIQSSDTKVTICPMQQTMALEAAQNGDTPTLRRLSLAKHSETIRTASNEESRTCLHLAALGGHVATLQWLITELGCPLDPVDIHGMIPLDYAKDENIRALFQGRGQL